MGKSSKVVVVLERSELKKAEVTARAIRIPRGVLENRPRILRAITLCSPVFSVAIASMNPPKNKKMIDLA